MSFLAKLAETFRQRPPLEEAAMFLYMGAIKMGGPAGNELVQAMTCHHMRHENIHINGTDYCDSDEVTGAASDHLFYLNLSMVIPSLFVVTALGAYSDKVGRRPMMLLPCIGSILQQLTILVAIYCHLPVPYLFVPMGLYGMFGTYALFLMSLFSAIADTTDPSMRTVRIGIMESMNLLGSFGGQLAGGRISDSLGYTAVFWTVTALYALTIVCIYFIKEPLPPSQRKTSVSWADANIVSVLLIMCRSGTLFLLSLGFFLLVTTQVGYQIVILYLRHLFHWSDSKVGDYLAVSTVCQGLSVLIVLPLLVAKFGIKAKDYPLLQISLVVMICQYVLWAIFRTPGVMFAVAVLGLIGGMAAPINRAMLSKAVPAHEQGAIFAAVGALEVVTGLTGPLIFNHVYSATVKTFDQAFLIVAAGMGFIVFLLMWLYAARRRAENVPLQMNTKEEDEPLLQDEIPRMEYA